MLSFTRVSLFAATFAVSLSAGAFAQVGGGASIGEYGGRFNGDQKVELSQVPNTARDVAMQQLGSANVTEVTQGYHRGDRIFVFEATDARGVHHSVTVTADGSVLQRD